jgi:predicted NBD/HSP70 family sugar kinase
MSAESPLPLPAPKVVPALDPGFRPAVLANHAFRRGAEATGQAVPVRLALEQADGSIFRFDFVAFPEGHPGAAGNARYFERVFKVLLWSRGGFRIHFAGPRALAETLGRYYRETLTGRFDAEIMGERVYERPFEIRACGAGDLPPAREATAPLGRHLKGCRIGFDLGASDRKAAAVVDGEVVFSEEVVWNPVVQTDPQWHFEEIMDSLRRAAAHLPRVDGIGGSSAGIYVNNRVKVASLFRGVPRPLFDARVKDLFLEIRRAWRDIPFEVVNDGEVTALAGSMALGDNAVLGTALGSSQAGGYVTPTGTITSWLNELAFVPVDLRPDAPADEWSGDRGCGAQYLSQQAVGRLLASAGIDAGPALSLPEKLKLVQGLMAAGDVRARRIYETIGTYLGYAVALYADFYTIRHVLMLGRVTSGEGGTVILDGARHVLRTEFPALLESLDFHVPGEKEKRHGQAIAAASLPVLA